MSNMMCMYPLTHWILDLILNIKTVFPSVDYTVNQIWQFPLPYSQNDAASRAFDLEIHSGRAHK